jgi:chromosome segregation ATPase
VGIAVAISDQLQAAGVGLSQLMDLIYAANSSSMEAVDLCQYYELMKQHNLSPKDISEAVSLKEELEKIGLSLDSLPSIVKVAESYGEPEKILQALSQYKKLVDLDHEIEITKDKLDSLNETLAGIQEQVEAAEVTLSQLKEPVEALDKAKQLGFGINEFEKVGDLAQKYGSAKKLLDAISEYDTYSDIQDKVNKAKADLTSLEADTQKLQLKHAHIQTAVNMCEKLTSEYGFGLDAISAILSAAKKYCDPITVLKAVEAYNKLEVILQEIDKQQGIISANKKEIAQLDGRHEDALKKLKELNDLALKVGSEVGKVQAEMKDSDFLKKLLALINEPYTAEYSGHINTAIPVALSLRHWVIKNETKFKNCNQIKSGLEFLIRELGGLL